MNYSQNESSSISSVGISRLTAPPTPLPVCLNTIPESIIAERRWVVWRYIWKSNGKQGGKWDKPPYRATATETLASATDPTTWRTFADARQAYEDGKCDGIGFVLGDGWVGFDVDESNASDYITLLNTYTERSPSGRGIHALMRGHKPGSSCRATREGVRYELYDRGRYFTVTGQHLTGTPTTIEERTTEIATLYADLFPPASMATARPPASASPSTRTDDEVLHLALTKGRKDKFRALWNGDKRDYHDDDSAANLALCNALAFWTNGDVAQMDRLFRRSGLMRAKWDERRGETTWGALTIDKAIGPSRRTR